jgi:tRNA (cytidine/uridine-2'-O-)-methyltransferase
MFQPDIAPNLGAAIRLCACLGVGLDVIEPCGFPLSDKALKRAAMDYAALCAPVRHDDWSAFARCVSHAGDRLVAIETGGGVAVHDFAFRPGDRLMVGRESAGLPADVLAACDAHVFVPMAAGARSFNVTVAAALALGEGLRRIGGWPEPAA